MRMQYLLSACLLATVAAGVSAQAPADRINGTVTYRQRMALPPDAVLYVHLEDVTRADAAATRIATSEIKTAGTQVPIAFELRVDPRAIDAARRYHVRALIRSGERLLFTSTQAYPVITNGAPTTVDIVVQPVGGKPAAPSTDSGLTGEVWTLIELGGVAVASDSVGSPAHFTLDRDSNSLSGSTGCNRFTGTYELGSQRSLRLDPKATTRMACPGPRMAREIAMLEVLKSTTTYRLHGDTLELRQGKQSLARFMATVR